MMNQDIKEKYIEAGEISIKVKKIARERCKPGKDILELANEIESKIRSLGGKPAFPVNISINDVSAHFTPGKETERKIKEDDVVKIDIGAHIDGYIADTAITINPNGKHDDLLSAAQATLDKVLDAIEPGLEIGKIGSMIQRTIEDRGFKPVTNLGGHYMDQYEQHTGDRIHNVSTNNLNELKKGDVIAIEPFATDGAGKIKNGSLGNIYRYKGGKVRSRQGRKLLRKIKSDYKTLPFTSRWIEKIPPSRLDMVLSKLRRQNVIKGYSTLKEINEGLVAQSEHTILVDDDPIITTR